MKITGYYRTLQYVAQTGMEKLSVFSRGHNLDMAIIVQIPENNQSW
jgi:hypothetical protein